MAFDSKYALNDAIRYLTKVAERRAAGGWVPPKERERQQREAMRQEQQQARQVEKQQKDMMRQEQQQARQAEREQQAQQKQFIADEKERQKNLMAWHKQSHPDTKNPDGTPKVFYHGTPSDFSTFDSDGGRAIFVTSDPNFAGAFASEQDGDLLKGGNLMPVHVHVKNPFDYQNTEHVKNLLRKIDYGLFSEQDVQKMYNNLKSGDWETIEDEAVQDAIKSLGHDGFYVNEVGTKNLGVFHPTQIKSATGNSGHFDPSNPDITKSEGGPILSKQFPTQYMPNVGRQVMNTGGTPDDPIYLYHGSGERNIQKFDPALAGSSTGSEYGEASVYASEEEPVAQEYKRRAEKRKGILYKGKPIREMQNDDLDSARAEVADRINDGYEPEEALQKRINHWLYYAKEYQNRAEKDPENKEKHLEDAKISADRANLLMLLDAKDFARSQGGMYKLKLLPHPHHFLDWNKPFHQQSDFVREKLTPIVERIDELYNQPRSRRGDIVSKYDQPQNLTGEKIYRYLQRHSDGKWDAPVDPKKLNTSIHKYSSNYLKQLGIRGITYLDSIWNAANPPRNYAVFHPEDVEIMERYARGGSVHSSDNERFSFATGGTNGTDETTSPEFTETSAQTRKLQDFRGIRGSVGNVSPSDQAFAEEALQGLPSKVKIPVTGETLMVGPDPRIRQVARNYMAQANLPYNPPKKYARVDQDRAKRIAQAFEEMPHDPDHPLVKASYDALINETMAQYRAAKNAGFKAEFWNPETEEDPYAASPRMATEDIRKNHHMYVFPTRFGYGSGEPITEEEIRQNPMLRDSGETWNGQPVTVNDIFRAVHDYYGHAKEGVGFRHDGEENAWRAHASMFSPLARMAMTTETRGQNSWLNFGPHGEKNKSARTEDTIFADQKIGVLPPWVMHEGAEDFVDTNDVDAIKKLYDQHFGVRENRARGGRASKKHPALSISGTHIREETHGKPIFTGRL